MPIRHIQRYVELTFTVDETIPERLTLPLQQHTGVGAQIANLRHNRGQHDGTLDRYADTVDGATGEPTP
jgi:hypothetical protein